MKPDSCVLALDSERRDQLGVQDPDNPIVRIVFTLVDGGDGMSVDRSTTIDPEAIASWLSLAPHALRRSLVGFELTFVTENDDVAVFEGGERSSKADARALAEHLKQFMIAARDDLRTILRSLPALTDLRARLEGQMRANIRYALDLKQRGLLPTALWQVHAACRDHHGHLNPEQLAMMAERLNQIVEVQARAQTAHLSGRRLALLLVSDMPCEGRTPVQTGILEYTEICARALLPAIIKSVYAEFDLVHVELNVA